VKLPLLSNGLRLHSTDWLAGNGSAITQGAGRAKRLGYLHDALGTARLDEYGF